MKKALFLLILILVAAVLGEGVSGERKCDELPLLMGDPPSEPSKGGEEVILVSLNMYEETDVNTILKEILESDPLHKADIFLLQEVVQEPDLELSTARKLARALNFYYAFAPAAPRRESTERGIAILSRYELRDLQMIQLRVYNLVLRSRCRVALMATLDTALGPIRIVNVHLDNRLNSREKVQQLGPVLEKISKHSGPRVVGGDFNTGNFLWLSHLIPIPYAQKQSNAVVEVMTEHGFSTPFDSDAVTFDHLGLRLDWVFLKELRALDSGVQPVRFSDHHAVWVQLGKADKAATEHRGSAPLER